MKVSKMEVRAQIKGLKAEKRVHTKAATAARKEVAAADKKAASIQKKIDKLEAKLA